MKILSHIFRLFTTIPAIVVNVYHYVLDEINIVLVILISAASLGFWMVSIKNKRVELEKNKVELENERRQCELFKLELEIKQKEVHDSLKSEMD